MLRKTINASVYGIDAYLVEVGVDVGSADMNQFNGVGLPENAVKERARTNQSGAQELRVLLSLWAGCDDQP
jgi:hypothetical protein